MTDSHAMSDSSPQDSLINIGGGDSLPSNTMSEISGDVPKREHVSEFAGHSSEPGGVSENVSPSASHEPNSSSTFTAGSTQPEPERSAVSSEVVDKPDEGQVGICGFDCSDEGNDTDNVSHSASNVESQGADFLLSNTDIMTSLIIGMRISEENARSDVTVEPSSHIESGTTSVEVHDPTPQLVSDEIKETVESDSDLKDAAALSESDVKRVDQGILPADEGTKSTTTTEANSGLVSSSETSSSESTQESRFYNVKWITFRDAKVPIITQSDNGSCPLLAILNTQFLLGRTTLQPATELITSNDMFSRLADCIFSNAPKDLTAESRPNYEQNVADALAVFPSLETGLDVNVRFTGVSAFEFTSACTVFDLLNIPLYHGWLVDPELPETVAAVGSCSYNQLVEKIIEQKSSKKAHLVTEAFLANEFITSTATQLTYHGLSELSSRLKEDQICVLFRNNHFSTLYKYKNELFVLVTDISFLNESNIVWETLSNVEGDGNFVDSNFRTYSVAYSKGSSWDVPQVPAAEPHQSQAVATLNRPVSPTVVPINLQEQIDHDYMVALSLEQDDVPGQATSWPQSSALDMELSDRELAVRLQEEEDAQAATAAAAAPSRSSDKLTQSSGSSVAEASGGQPANGGGKDTAKSKEKDKDKEKDKSSCQIM